MRANQMRSGVPLHTNGGYACCERMCRQRMFLMAQERAALAMSIAGMRIDRRVALPRRTSASRVDVRTLRFRQKG